MKSLISHLLLILIIFATNINTESDIEIDDVRNSNDDNINKNNKIKTKIYDLSIDEKDRISTCNEISSIKLTEEKVK
jgi:hypothetical protein